MWISAVSLFVLLSVLWRTFAPWIVPNFICWQELLEKQHFTHSFCLQSPLSRCFIPCGNDGTQSFVLFWCTGALLLLFNYSGTKFGGLVWFTVTGTTVPCRSMWNHRTYMCTVREWFSYLMVNTRFLKFKTKKKNALNMQKEAISIWGLLGSSGLIWADIFEATWWVSIFLLSYGRLDFLKKSHN